MRNATTDTDTKEVIDFAERLRYVLELKINKLRTIMQNSNNHYDSDMAMISIWKFTIHAVTFMFIYNYLIIVTHVETTSASCLYFMCKTYNA